MYHRSTAAGIWCCALDRLDAVAYNADPELAKTFAVADIFANNEELIMNNDTEEELLNLLTEVYEGLRELCDRIENVIAKG